jgi:hypothetical protein
MVSGADSVNAATEYLKALQTRRDEWPYVHVYPPKNAIDVFFTGALEIPQQATGPAEILRYQVNAGKVFFLRSVIFGAVGSNGPLAIVPGQALFTVDRNSEIGAVNVQFNPEHGLINVPFAVGNFQDTRGFRFERAREFKANDIIRIKGSNVGLSAGNPNFFVAGIFGYEVPTLDVHTLK